MSFIMFLLVIIIVWFIVVKSYRAYQKADVKEKMDELSLTSEINDSIPNIEKKEVEKKRKNIEKFMDL